MALAAGNITPRKANTEMGSPFGATPNNLAVHDVCRRSGQNAFSFYGPWPMTKSSYLPVISYGTSNDKLGDFRLYNHSAATPKAATNFTRKWSGNYVEIVMVSFPYEYNVLEADANAQYITYRFYTTTSARTAGTGYLISYTDVWNSSAAPLYGLGHTRNQSIKIASTHISPPHTINTIGFSTPTDYLYVDTYFSDISGNRLLHMGSLTNGYTTITLTEVTGPILDGGATVSSPPSGYTAIWPAIATTSTKCLDETISETNGSTTYDFWISMVGVYGSITRTHQITSCTISLKVGGVTAAIKTSQAIGYTSKTHITGTIPSGLSGGAFNNGESWTVEVSNITWGSGYSTC